MSNFLPLDISPSKPNRVFLYGESQRLPTYIKFLNELDIEISGIIGDSVFPEIQNVSREAAGREPDIPIIITAGSLHLPVIAATPNESDGSFLFKNLLSQLLTNETPNHILHPSFIADFIDIPLHNAAFISGPPGSGNILAQRIIAAIVRENWRTESDEEIFLSHICQNYDYQVLSHILESTYDLNVLRTEMMSFGLGFTNYMIQCANDAININDIRSRRHIYQKIYGTHQLLNESVIKKLRAVEYHQFVCQRHPFDSCISIQYKGSGGTEKLDKIDIKMMFGDIAQRANFLKHVIDAGRNNDDLFIIRYEDLLSKPSQTIVAIAAHMGISIVDEDADKIWQDIGMRPLPDAPPGHFRDPKIFGWKNILDEKAVTELSNTHVFPIFRGLGYSIDELGPIDFSILCDEAEALPKLNNSKRDGNSLFDTIWLMKFHREESLLNSVKEKLDSDFFKALCRSADYGV